MPSADIFGRKQAEVYAEYQTRLLAAGAMDFDDLLVNVVALFRGFPDVLAEYQRRFQHVLVDEYQDTNQAQNDIVLMLASAHGNVTVVGDTDQSVYGFRGADFRNILQFEEAFDDGVTTVVLDQNYRSTQTILDAANAIIANNSERKPKSLWTDAAPATGSCGSSPRTSPTRLVTSAPRPTTCATATPSTGARWRCCTAPTPRAGRSRRRSCASACRTRWSAAPATTTGARSATPSPTCARW